MLRVEQEHGSNGDGQKQGQWHNRQLFGCCQLSLAPAPPPCTVGWRWSDGCLDAAYLQYNSISNNCSTVFLL